MNKKAQDTLGGLGLMIGVFVGIVAALALLQASFGNLGLVTNLQWVNGSESGASSFTQSIPFDLEGKSVSNFMAINGSDSLIITAGTCPGAQGECNHSTSNNVLNANGELTAQANISAFFTSANLSYNYQDVGYIPSAGGRSIAGLIAIFAALAIVVLALVPTFRSGVMNFFGR